MSNILDTRALDVQISAIISLINLGHSDVAIEALKRLKQQIHEHAMSDFWERNEEQMGR